MDTTGACYASNNWMAEKINVERRTIIASLKRLIEANYIKRIIKDGHRFLSINITNCIEEVVILRSPPSDPTITPPSDPTITQLVSNTITSKKINNIKRARDEKPSLDPSYKYPDTLYESSKNKFTDRNKNNPLELNYSKEFERFWEAYPVKKNKPRAYMLWLNSNLDEKVEEIITKLLIQKETDAHWLQNYVPSACNYITGDRWNDDIAKLTKKNRLTAEDHNSRTWADSLHDHLF